VSKEVSDQVKFYGSEKIAPLVRRLSIADYYEPSCSWSKIEAVLSLIRTIPNLDCIVFGSSHIGARIMHEIGQRQTLTSIEMNSCISSNAEPPRLHLQTVHLLRHRRSDADRSWPFTVQPELLESLHVDKTAFPMLSSLPNLRNLWVEPCGNRFTELVPVIECLNFLSRCSCPALETLVFSKRAYADGSPADVVGLALPALSRLQRYNGPSTFVPLFASGGSLLHATLHEYDYCDYPPEGVAGILQNLHALAPNLVSLSTQVPCLEEADFHAACLFPKLEELHFYSVLSEDEGYSMQARTSTLQLEQDLISGRFTCHTSRMSLPC
jgi:hypothetical protein